MYLVVLNALRLKRKELKNKEKKITSSSKKKGKIIGVKTYEIAIVVAAVPMLSRKNYLL